MLIAHHSSTCDVCLEPYTEDCSYHTIPCGHVFCLPCLLSTNPSKCPLCRHEFSSYTMRKLHLTLPSAEDFAARELEMKLVQSSPDMSFADSLVLFREVQGWLEGKSEEEFLVLRAFAAVLCGFHEVKEKLVQSEQASQQSEGELRRMLEEARNIPTQDTNDYKSKYQGAKAELRVLRDECAELRNHVELYKQHEEKRSAEYQAHYAHIQAQVQAHTQTQTQTDPPQASRRVSNPLPTPPRPVEIPFLKIIEDRDASQLRSGSKGKGKESSSSHHPPAVDVDPLTSVFVPTLSASIPSSSHENHAEGRSVVTTTLVFKAPKRVPMWDSPTSSYGSFDNPVRGASDQSGSLPPLSDTGASVGGGAVPSRPAVDIFHFKKTYHAERRPSSPANPVSSASASSWGESSRSHTHNNRAPSPEQSRNMYQREPHRPSRESYPIVATSSYPVTRNVSIPQVQDPNVTPTNPRVLKRASVNDIDVTHMPRRASSPAVTSSISSEVTPTSYPGNQQGIITIRTDGTQQGVINIRTDPSRSYRVHLLDDIISGPENHADRERGVHRDRDRNRNPRYRRSPPLVEEQQHSRTRDHGNLRPPSPLIKPGKERSRDARHVYSRSTNALPQPSTSRAPAPPQSRSHDDLHAGSYSAHSYPVDNDKGIPSGRVYAGELSSTTWHMSGAEPVSTPVGEL